jgi:hypothetical protein
MAATDGGNPYLFAEDISPFRYKVPSNLVEGVCFSVFPDFGITSVVACFSYSNEVCWIWLNQMEEILGRALFDQSRPPDIASVSVSFFRFWRSSHV